MGMYWREDIDVTVETISVVAIIVVVAVSVVTVISCVPGADVDVAIEIHEDIDTDMVSVMMDADTVSCIAIADMVFVIMMEELETVKRDNGSCCSPFAPKLSLLRSRQLSLRSKLRTRFGNSALTFFNPGRSCPRTEKASLIARPAANDVFT